MKKEIEYIDKLFIRLMHGWSIRTLRITLAIVFLWFGALKVLGVSPVVDLIQHSYSFFPEPAFITVLGIWEMIIGITLLFNSTLRLALALLWLQMAGTLFAPLFNSSLFFDKGNIFLLTIQGEFIVKNLVLIASSLVIGGYAVGKRTQSNHEKT